MPDEASTPWSGGYGERTFTPGTVAETRRLVAMAKACDPATIAVLANLPVPPGGRCLEIGAGSGTVAQWIADNLSPRETVATDLDIRELEKIHRPALRIVRHDVRTESFPPGSFDLIVARNVLCNLPGRETALARMTSPAGQSWKLSIQALASTMVGGGEYTPAQIADFQSHLNDPEFADIGYAMVAAWGQRPDSRG